jgi:hypothetical protein
MNESNRRVIKFLEKEIKTYTALSLFLSKNGIAEHLRKGNRGVLVSPAFYKERMKEAKKLVFQLRKTD